MLDRIDAVLFYVGVFLAVEGFVKESAFPDALDETGRRRAVDHVEGGAALVLPFDEVMIERVAVCPVPTEPVLGVAGRIERGRGVPAFLPAGAYEVVEGVDAGLSDIGIGGEVVFRVEEMAVLDGPCFFDPQFLIGGGAEQEPVLRFHPSLHVVLEFLRVRALQGEVFDLSCLTVEVLPDIGHDVRQPVHFGFQGLVSRVALRFEQGHVCFQPTDLVFEVDDLLGVFVEDDVQSVMVVQDGHGPCEPVVPGFEGIRARGG